MSIEITKTMRYEIEYKKELYNILSDIQYAVWRIKNKAVSMDWDWQRFSFGYNERFGKYPSQTKLLGKTLSPDIYGIVKEWAQEIYSQLVDSSVQESVNKFRCVICGYKTHADFNAAKNISNPRIEKLIKDELERQERERKLAT